MTDANVEVSAMLPQAPYVQQFAVAVDPELHLIAVQQLSGQKLTGNQCSCLDILMAIDETLQQRNASGSRTGQKETAQISGVMALNNQTFHEVS